jgi:hypothetical protein
MKKRIYIERGDLIINVNKKCFFTIFTEWDQLFGKHNWYSFTPIHIFYENDKMVFGHFFQITLLGFGISFRYNTDKAFLDELLSLKERGGSLGQVTEKEGQAL